MYPPDFVAWVKETHPQLSSLVDPSPRETVPELISRVGRYVAEDSADGWVIDSLATAVEEELCRYASPAS